MAKTSPIINSFNSGEFSPLMVGRTDYKYYTNACRRIRNFVLTPQGPARRRPGTYFVAEVKSSANRTWLWRFEFNIEQAYVLEFGHQCIRFFANHGVVGAPLEVVTPYTAADLTTTDGTFNLRFVQSGDVLYICHPNYAPRKLARTGAATFTISTLETTGGPFKDIEPDETITVYASASTGTGVTLTASSSIFTADHVGSLFFLEQRDTDGISQWEAGKAVGVNNVRRSDGKNYHCLVAGTTGSIKPTHSRGAKYDGSPGAQWQFDDPGYGWCKITAYTSGTVVTADVLSRIPDGATLVANATTRWAHAAWSNAEGWPTNVTFFRERLVFARGQDVWLSVSADFENFKRKDDGGMVVADMSIVGKITSDRANRIEWIAPSDTALLIGTAGDEHVLNEISTTEALGPANAKARKQSEYGSRHVPTARVGDDILFSQKAGRKIRGMRQAESVNERWVSDDLTVRAEHVTRGGVVDMAYQQEPDSVLWCVKADGGLVAMTINRGQDVMGWHPHRLGGYSNAAGTEFAAVESVVSIPSPDGGYDEVWVISRRHVNGATKRYIEYITPHHEKTRDQEDAFYIDCGLTLDNKISATLTPGTGADVKGTTGVVFTAGSAVFSAPNVGRRIHYRYSTVNVKGDVAWHTAVALITGYTDTTHVTCTILSPWPNLTAITADRWRMTVTTVTGLSHLEGEEVQVVTDGASHPVQTVVSGSITLAEPASKVHVGLACPAVIQPMPLDAAAQDGTAQGKTQRISKCVIRFDDTLGCKYGRDEDTQLDQIPVRGGGDDMDVAPPLFTGDEVVSWPDGYDAPALITIIQSEPFPATVVCIMPQISTSDAR